MIAAIVMYIMAAPAGYLAGDIFAHQQELSDKDAVPISIAAALLPPLAALLAVIVLLKEEVFK